MAKKDEVGKLEKVDFVGRIFTASQIDIQICA
jgi:hypothetical protein